MPLPEYKVSTLFLGTKVGTGSLCAHNICEFLAVYCFVLAAKLACTQTLCFFSFRSFRKHRHKSPAVYSLSRALDGLWRENRGSMNRLLLSSCFKMASDRAKRSSYVLKVWTQHHFVPAPRHWFLNTKCGQPLITENLSGFISWSCVHVLQNGKSVIPVQANAVIWVFWWEFAQDKKPNQFANLRSIIATHWDIKHGGVASFDPGFILIKQKCFPRVRIDFNVFVWDGCKLHSIW